MSQGLLQVVRIRQLVNAVQTQTCKRLLAQKHFTELEDIRNIVFASELQDRPNTVHGDGWLPHPFVVHSIQRLNKSASVLTYIKFTRGVEVLHHVPANHQRIYVRITLNSSYI
jgi:hypothetical protein